MKKTDNLTLKTKRIIGIVSLLAALGVLCLVAYFAIYRFFKFGASAKDFESFIEGYGWSGRFVALGIQILQVFIAIIPGEFVEVGLGYAFGAIEGTLLCLAGIAAGSALIFILVKKWGVRLVELCLSTEKINSLKFINSEKKLSRVVFFLFLIPGTPKDLLTYIVPLTRMKISEFMILSLIARIPSVASSTIGGDFFGSGKYLEGLILLLITAAISLIGLKIYNVITEKYQKRKDKRSLED